MAEEPSPDILMSRPAHIEVDNGNLDERYELHKGEAWKRGPSTIRHNMLVYNLVTALNAVYAPHGGRAFSHGVELKFEQEWFSYYPDVMVVASYNQREAVIRAPFLVVEVLSESTIRRDVGEKLEVYMQLASLKAYILVAQQEYWVRVFERKGKYWQMHPLLSRTELAIDIKSMGLHIPIEKIYQGIMLDSPAK